MISSLRRLGGVPRVATNMVEWMSRRMFPSQLRAKRRPRRGFLVCPSRRVNRRRRRRT